MSEDPHIIRITEKSWDTKVRGCPVKGCDGKMIVTECLMDGSQVKFKCKCGVIYILTIDENYEKKKLPWLGEDEE